MTGSDDPEGLRDALAGKRREREAAAAKGQPAQETQREPKPEELTTTSPAEGSSAKVPFRESNGAAANSQRGWTERQVARKGPVSSPNIQRALPHSVEAEQGILGSMIISPRDAIPLAVQHVTVAYFYIPAHQTVFLCMVEVFQDKGTLDLITFTQYLRDVGQLDKVGGPSFITGLFTFVPTSGLLGYYIEIVRDKYILREIIAASTENARRAYEEQDEVNLLVREVTQRMEVVQTLSTGPSRLPHLSDLSLMLGANRPVAPAELVKGILHQGSKMIVGGTSKGRKTFSLLDLAISVATGSSWWGFPCVQGRVCYINFEIQESFFCERVEIIAQRKGVVLPLGALMGWNLRGHGEGIEHLMADLLATLRTMGFVLIIFDPIYKALGNRDENKAGDVASLCNELEKVAVRTGAAIAFGAHYSKGNQAAKESIDRIGGSGVFARDPDSILTMTPHQEEDAFTVDATLRNLKPLQPFVIRWDWPLFIRDDDLDPEQLRQQRKAGEGGRFKQKYSDSMVLDEMSVLEGTRPGALAKRLELTQGMSLATTKRYITALYKEKKIIERDGKLFITTK